jgi:hypothetical protein
MLDTRIGAVACNERERERERYVAYMMMTMMLCAAALCVEREYRTSKNGEHISVLIENGNKVYHFV